MTSSPANAPAGVLVTGAAGFIGRHVVAALIDRGLAVVAADLRPLPPALAARCVRTLTGDLADESLRREAVRGAGTVCHLAACLPEKLDDPGEAAVCLRVNALGTLDLARDAAAAGVRRFVYLSGGNIYAPSAVPCTEDAPVYPAGYAAGYLVSKLAGELLAANVCGRAGMEGVMLRAGTPYGPGEPPRKVIPAFLRQAAQGLPLRVAAGGTAAFNFVHVADVADCVVRAAGGGPAGIYNVASGEHTALRELAQAVAALHPPGYVAVEIAPPVPGAFAGFPPLSVERARATWGFAPRPLAIGLRDYQRSLAAESAA